MKLGWKVTMGLALVNTLFNIGVILYSYFTGDQVILAWGIGYSAFSTYYLNQQIKKLKEVLSYGRVVAENVRPNQ
jgi:hypothetical protein